MCCMGTPPSAYQCGLKKKKSYIPKSTGASVAPEVDGSPIPVSLGQTLKPRFPVVQVCIRKHLRHWVKW